MRTRGAVCSSHAVLSRQGLPPQSLFLDTKPPDYLSEVLQRAGAALWWRGVLAVLWDMEPRALNSSVQTWPVEMKCGS